MARRCKCAITGEIGDTDTFVKIGNRYYKSREIYDKVQREKESYKNLVDYICTEFLGYGDGQPFPPILPKKLKELSDYSNNVIMEAFRKSSDNIRYALDHKTFSGEYGKIAYIFAIVKNRISEVAAEEARLQKQMEHVKQIRLECSETGISGTKAKGKNISSFLEDDDM